jgi:haloacid dehalogenase superfamily, subfamily IA, variant 1 with third motif having Dx(3-4)D or Dx(3-4)E
MKNCVFFDLGYTLIYNIKHEIYTTILQDLGHEKNLNEVNEAFKKADKHFMKFFPGLFMKSHESYEDAYITLVNYFLGIFEPTRQYADSYHDRMCNTRNIWKTFDDTYEVLDRLKKNGVKLGLVTNWNPDCRRILTVLGLIGYFDVLIISSEVNVEKPDERIFRMALEQMSATPQESLFIGDNYYDDGVGSMNVGIDFAIIERTYCACSHEYKIISGLSDVLALV